MPLNATPMSPLIDCLLNQPPLTYKMAPMEVPEDARENGTIYFCYEHAVDSFTGVLVEDYALTDNQLKDYIRYDNPNLFHRLRGLPFTSSDVPLSYHAQRQLKKTHAMQQAMEAECKSKQVPKESSYEILESASQDTKGPNFQVDCALLELQLKRYVQMSLLNGYSLLLRKLQSHSNPCFCNSPTCSFGNLILSETFYITLKHDIFPNGYTGLSEVCNETYYCLQCLEDVFDGKRCEVDHVSERLVGTSIDGIDHGLVIDAASRLYHAEDSKPTNTLCPSEIEALRTTSSSAFEDTLEIRLKRKQEVELALNEIEKFERCRTRSQESAGGIDAAASPSLHITRPAYMEPAKDRYKKQGFGRRSQVLALSNSQSSPSQGIPSSANLRSDIHLRCYCREPDSGMEAMIKCDNNWCSIGWFHARCAGRTDEDSDHEDFVCGYCREDYGPFEPVSGNETMDEITAMNDMILEHADEIADEEEAEASWGTDEESDQDDNTTQTSKAAHWGTPINIQSPPTPARTADHTLHPPIDSPPNQPEQLDGTSLSPTSSTFTFNSNSSTVFHPIPFHDPLAKSLFPGSSNTKFSDLAPFITTSDLTAREVERFESWKHSQPPSKLVRALLSNSCGGGVGDDDDGNGDSDSDGRDANTYVEARQSGNNDTRAFSRDDDSGGRDGQRKRLSQLLEESSP